MKTRFVYLERSPKLAGKARQFGASYRRMMVLELEHGAEIPPAVKPGAKGLVRIVDESTESIGKTAASYGFRERARLRALADTLNASARLEYLRGEILAGCVSYGEIIELQELAQYISPGDTLLLEWAGVPETVTP